MRGWLVLGFFAFAQVSPSTARAETPGPKVEKKLLKRLGKSICTGTPRVSFLGDEASKTGSFTRWKVEDCGDHAEVVITYWTYRGAWTVTDDLAVRAKAPFDLDCPANDLSYTFIDATTRGVSGCDQRITYVLVPYTGWVANMRSQ